MANLDKLLKQIEKRHELENEGRTETLNIGGEEYEVRLMKRNDKKEFTYIFLELSKDDYDMAKISKKAIPYIYRSVTELAPLAVKAKDAGLIKSNYDIVEENFSPIQILEIITFLAKFNNINDENIIEEIDEIKKQ